MHYLNRRNKRLRWLETVRIDCITGGERVGIKEDVSIITCRAVVANSPAKKRPDYRARLLQLPAPSETVRFPPDIDAVHSTTTSPRLKTLDKLSSAAVSIRSLQNICPSVQDIGAC